MPEIVARHADAWNWSGAVEEVGARNRMLDEVIGRYREAGIEEFIIDQPPDTQFGVLERVATDVIPALRAARA